MKKLIGGIIMAVCFFTLAAWVWAHADTVDRDRGNQYADRKRQSDDENIKRTQGDESGRRDIQNQANLLNDERGRW